MTTLKLSNNYYKHFSKLKKNGAIETVKNQN